MFENTDMEDASKDLETGLTVLAGRKGVPELAGSKYFAGKLTELMALVLERNEITDLTSITEPDEFVRLHLLDSLACAGVSGFDNSKEIIDVGTGAGFPGLPLAILYPEKNFVLTDSLKKRTEFVEYAAGKLDLKNVNVFHSRAETLGHDPDFRERFDFALCRAVGKLPVVLEYCVPFVKVGGSAIFYKTIPAEGEIEDSLMARRLLGCVDSVRVETYKDILPGREHALFIISKSKPTPDKYPRREGTPSKVPL